MWNNTDENWYITDVRINFKNGGRFIYRMETKDGKQGFDHKGKFDEIIPYRCISYTLDDGRKTINSFNETGETTRITETFMPENETPLDVQ
jgi:uncharacterized protein YndB with AHSA1/START domain